MEAHPLPLLPSEIRLRNLFHQSAGPSFLANFRCVRNSIRRNKSSPECNSFDKMWQPLEWMKPAQPATFAATLNFGSKIFKSGDEKTFRETSSAAMIYWRNLWNQRLVPWPGGLDCSKVNEVVKHFRWQTGQRFSHGTAPAVPASRAKGCLRRGPTNNETSTISKSQWY